MSLNFIDGFDHNPNAVMDESLLPKWGTQSLYGGVVGRFGTGRAMRFISSGYYLSQDPGNPGTSDKLIVGFAYNHDPLTVPMRIMAFRDGTTEILKLELQLDGTIDAVVDAGVVASTTIPTIQGIFHYIEVKVLLHDSNGTVDFQIDGEAAGSATGQDTIGSAATSCTNVIFQSEGAPDWQLDDVYMADSSPAGATDFLGDVQVIARVPTADHGSPDFTPSAGSNWENLDDTYLSATDTTYNQSNTSGHEDLFTCDSFGLVATDTVHGVQVNAFHKKVDGGAADMYLRLDNGAGSETSAAKTVLTSYQSDSELYILDVADGVSAWDDASVDTIEFGYERV